MTRWFDDVPDSRTTTGFAGGMEDRPPPTATEFGGVDGGWQPPGYEPAPSERLRQVYAIDPTDATTEIETDEEAPSIWKGRN